MMARIVVLLAALLLAACASVPRTVDVSLEQLHAAVAKRFPHNERLLQLLDVQVTAPQLQLLPESNRLRVELAVAAANRVLPRPLRGELAVSFAPRYEPADATVRMAQVRVERFELPGVPEPARRELQRLGPAIAEKALEDAILHALRPEELARAQGWTPGELRVTASGLRITLQPPPR